MNAWTAVFLGIIAAATLAIAIVQVGVLVAAARLARRLERFVDDVEREVKPIFGNIDAMTRDASRAASLAVGQMERVDQLFADLGHKIEQTLAGIQEAVIAPLREGRALMLGLRAVMAAIRAFRPGTPRRGGEEDDALFI